MKDKEQLKKSLLDACIKDDDGNLIWNKNRKLQISAANCNWNALYCDVEEVLILNPPFN